jgi:eukaryotic-like serine/threonine-protein kinase
MRPSEAASRARAAAANPAADSSFIGTCLQGRYRIEAQLGAGGVGKVYRARHLGLDRSVALKVLRKQHNEHWGSRQRFEREARALGTLIHPHIVAVTDFGIEGDVPFLVMELLEGESLESRLRAGPLDAELAYRCAHELLAGLAFVHERGLVHRDIKPGNIFLERTEQGPRLKLLDFGLAKLVVAGTDANLTRSGEVFGTPAYMAPEQVTGEAIDARADVYAAGLVLFEIFAGRRPFIGSDSELLRQQLVDPLPRLGDVRPGVLGSEQLDSLLLRATHKEQKQRFAAAGEMAAAFEALAPRRATGKARSRRPAAPRRSRVGAVLRAGAVLLCGVALAAIVLAGGVIYLLGSPDGASHRVLLQRALAPLMDERAAPAER